MSDEFVLPAIKPAVPSRQPMFEDVQLPPKPARAERLPEDEIERIKTNRRKNLKKKKIQKRIAPAPKPPTPPSPNRPLEMKNRLHTVLGAVVQMSKQESTSFAGCMAQLEDMSRGARRRVIAALEQVYG